MNTICSSFNNIFASNKSVPIFENHTSNANLPRDNVHCENVESHTTNLFVERGLGMVEELGVVSVDKECGFIDDGSTIGFMSDKIRMNVMIERLGLTVHNKVGDEVKFSNVIEESDENSKL